MRKISLLFIVVLLILTLCGCSGKPESVEAFLIENSESMYEFGHLIFDMSADSFLEHFALGDIVTVTIDGHESMDMPVCTSYDDVSAGEMLLRAVPGKDNITLAINYGQIGVVLDILEETADDTGIKYTIKNDVRFPLKMTASLKEKDGWKDRLVLSTLVRPNHRDEYAAELSDEEFSNFREIRTSGIAPNILYRSSSPINDVLGRNKIADALAEKAGIRTCFNMADSEAKAADYPDFAGSYYSSMDVICCQLPAAPSSQVFSAGFAEGLRYMMAHEGPYLIHCTEGKDRTGFAAAVLELFMGASLDEVKADYLTTYENFYAELKNGGAQLNDDMREIICSMIIKTLEYGYGIDDITSVDTQKVTEEYLCSIGLSKEELTSLRACLGE